MKTINHTVSDPNGIHARPAGVIVNAAKKFESDITIICGDKNGDCKRIFSVMGLSLKKGDSFSIRISGKDEDEAEAVIKEALSNSGI